MKINITEDKSITIDTLLLDANGTLTIDGILIDGVKERITELKKHFEIIMLTGDRLGTAGALADKLEIKWELASTAAEKQLVAERMGSNRCASIGNGAIDAKLLGTCALGIAVIQEEGLSPKALNSADILTLNIIDALDLLINPNRIGTTLRP